MPTPDGSPPIDAGWFPDVEQVVGEALRVAVGLPAGHVDSETPDDLEAQLPFLQVVRYGGPDDGVTDSAAVDVDWFAETRAEALDLARRGHQILLAGRLIYGAALIDGVIATVGVVERPRLGAIRRFGGSYTVSSRRVRA